MKLANVRYSIYQLAISASSLSVMKAEWACFFFEHAFHLPFIEAKFSCKQGSIQMLLPDPITVTGRTS